MSVVASEVFVDGTDKTKFLCEICKISFCERKNLNRHLQKFHQMQIVGKPNRTCALCDEKFHKMNVLHEHLQNQHSINLKFSYVTFYLEKDFQDWKKLIERESQSSYVFRNITRNNSSGITHAYYSCHRSGPFKLKQNRTRRMKASGSIKTSRTCPAFMKVSTETVDDISEIKVQYQSVHLGHELETRTLRISKEEREKLAACLKLGIPIDKLLDDIRRIFSPTSRFRNLTRKHLHNICRDFGIPLNREKPKKAKAIQNADNEMSDSTNGFEDYVEPGISYHEEVIEHEKNTAISSLLLLQNPDDESEQLKKRKMQIIDQLKELQFRIGEWNLQCPLPNIEEHIKAINACLDSSASSNNALNSFLMITPSNTFTT